MSNKTDLQANNADLQQILQAVQALPTAVPWGGSTIIEPGSEAVTIPAYTDTELTVNPVQTEEKTVTPSSGQQIITPATGKYLSKVTVEAIPNQYVDVKSILGYSKSDIITFTQSKRTRVDAYTIRHSLGVIPKLVMILSDATAETTTYDLDLAIGMVSSLYDEDFLIASILQSEISSTTMIIRDGGMNVTKTTILFSSINNCYYAGGKTYTVLLFA